MFWGLNSPGNKTQDAVRPREAQDGQTDVFGKEQSGSYLPAAGAVLDGISFLKFVQAFCGNDAVVAVVVGNGSAP